MHAQLGKRLGDVGTPYSSIFALRTFPSGLATYSVRNDRENMLRSRSVWDVDLLNVEGEEGLT